MPHSSLQRVSFTTTLAFFALLFATLNFAPWTATPASAAPPTIVGIDGGGSSTCAITDAGAAYCWGRNTGGQLGDGTTIQRTRPVAVIGLGSGVVAISAGGAYACALTNTGAVYCWGDNAKGQLGDGTTTQRLTPVAVTGLGSGVLAISAGSSHACALTNAGAAFCWGENVYSQLGDGTNIQRTAPVAVTGLGSGVATITAGIYHTCAVTSAGAARCWGRNDYNQLGDGTNTIRATPVAVIGLGSGVAKIDLGYAHTCALTSAGAVSCWGGNAEGQLGDGTNIAHPVPTTVTGLGSGVAAIGVDNGHSCAVTSAGATFCWGDNFYNQLGDGTNIQRTTPTAVTSLGSGVVTISAGSVHTCVRTSVGDALCWGRNVFGTLGDGTTTSRTTPVAVLFNTPPTISNIANQITNQNTAVGPIAFTVGDIETAVASLTISATSSNLALVPVANIVFGGGGANRTITVTPAAGQIGTATISVTVSDGGLSASDTLLFTVTGPSPGGVVGAKLWLKANSGLSTTGTTVTSWADQSGNSLNATAVGTPLLKTNGLNGNPTIEFSGAPDRLATPAMQLFATNASGLTTFTIFDTDNNAGQKFVLNQGFAPACLTSFELGYDTGNGTGNGNFGLHAGCSKATLAPPNTILNNTFSLLSTVVLPTGTAPNNINIFQNGTLKTLALDGTGWTNAGAYDTRLAPLDIGVRNDYGSGNYGGYHLGDIAEVIIYPSALNTLNREKVESYLALKYGMTLIHDYTSSGGVLLWDVGASGGYDNNIAGIGVDSTSGLSQLQSTSISDNLITLTGQAGNIVSGEFLLWGDDNGTLTGVAQAPAGTSERLSRRWRIGEVGDTGPITVLFNLTTITDLDFTGATSLALLVDNDGDFSNATVAATAPRTGANVTFANVNLASGQYIGLGVVNTAPTISTIVDQTTTEDAVFGPLAFTVGDGETASAGLLVSATSSNPTLVPVANIALGGSGASRTTTITPAVNLSGISIITITVSDGVLTASESFAFTVNPENDAPTSLSLSNTTLDENQPSTTTVGSFSTSDIDGGPTYAYSLVSGAGDSGNNSFSIIGDSLRTAATFDYEAQPSYSIRVEVSDGNGGSFANIFTISIGDVNVAPTITSVTPPGGQYSQSYSHTFTASGEPTATFSLTAGALPPGLTLDATSGLLSGTLTQAGTFGPLTVTASNGTNPAATQTFFIVVSPALLNVVANDQTRIYGAANPVLTFAATGFVNGDTADTALTGALTTIATAASPASSYVITQGSLAAANYTISFTQGALNITRAVLIATADNQTRFYGATNPTLTFSYSGFVNGDDASVLDLVPLALTTATPASPVANYLIDLSGGSDNDYSFSYSGATLTVTPAALAVIADNKARTYGATNPPFTFTTTGLVNGDTAATALVGELVTTAATVSPVGDYPIVQGSLAASNYTIAFTSSTLTIGSAVLEVVADPQSRAYGSANPLLTYGISGFVNGDDASSMSGTLTTTAVITSPVGGFAITQGTLSALNYAINYTGANLTINRVSLSVLADDQSRTYGSANPPFTYTASGFVNSDTAATALTGELASTTIPSSSVGSYLITQGNLAAANYAISFTSASLRIVPAPLSIIADNQMRSYGAVNPPLSYTASGFVNNEEATSTLTGMLATSAVIASPVGSYPILQGTLAAANYIITFSEGSLSITPATLSIEADFQSRLYGAANPSFTYRSSGFVNGEDVRIITGTLSATATITSDIGSYVINQGNLGASNYTIVYIEANLSITPIILTVTVDNQTRLFGATNPPLTFSYSGFVNGEDQQVLDITPTASTSANPTSPVGSYPISLVGGSDHNYSFRYVTGTLTITPTGQILCTGSALRALFTSSGSVIELDGTCRYQLSETTGSNGHLINLFARRDLTINGNGAIIERTSDAADLGILAVIDSENITIKNLTLIGGQANGASNQFSGRGGGIMLYNSPNVTLNGVLILNSRGTLGGGLSIFGGSTKVSNSVFANNQASGNGAAIYAQGILTITNSTFTDNAVNPREAIFAWDALSVQSSIIANHALAFSAAGGGDKLVSEDYNLFSNVGQLQQIFNQGTQISNGKNSFTVPDFDQQFANPAEHDYRLKVSAAAIDRGLIIDNADADADGRTRPFGSTHADIGAYEFQGDASLKLYKLAPRWVKADVPFTIQIVIANRSRVTVSGLELRDTLPTGLSFVGGLSTSGSFDGTTVRWNLTSLAPDQIITLEYQVKASYSAVSDDYSVTRLSDDSILASGQTIEIEVKPGIIASLDSLDQQIFTPGINDFGFANWRESARGTNLAVETMYLLYGPGSCARGTEASATSCKLTATAARQSQSLQKLIGNGRAFGMAVASLKLFRDQALPDGRRLPADFQSGVLTSADLLRSIDLEQLITLYQAGRSGIPQGAAGAAQVTNGNVVDLIAFLQAHGFDGPSNDDAYTLSLRQLAGGTTLVPYALERRAGNLYWLYVYDPDAPGDRERVVALDTSLDTWSYTGVGSSAPLYSGNGQSRSIALRSLNYDTSLPKRCGFCSPTALASTLAATGDAEGDGIVFTLNGPGRLLLTNADGQRIGYDPASGAFINDIPGAALETLDGATGAVLVHVPLNTRYTVALFSIGSERAIADLTVTAPGMIAELGGLQLANSRDPARMSIDYATQQIAFIASTIDNSGMGLTLGAEAPKGNSYSFTTTGTSLAQGKSITTSFNTTTEQLSITDDDPGQSQRYNLSLVRVEPGGATQTLQRNNITSGRGAGALLDFSSWDGLDWPLTTSVLNYLYVPIVHK